MNSHKLAGLSTATISQVETGTTTKPHLSTLIRLKSSLQEQGIEFVDGGWMRHLDDSGHEQDASQPDVENELFHANIIENARLLTHRLLRILSKASQQPSKPGTAQEE